MWTTFVRDKTKIDYANSIRIRAKLYGARYEKGKHMDKFLEGLEDLRRQLENMNMPIEDADMASIILTAVESTHRTIVRMFNQDGNPPDLNRVLNTLRGEAEIDSAENERNAGKESDEEDKKQIGSMKQGKGKPPQKGKLPKKKGGGKKPYVENRKCHYCGEKGHLQAACRFRLADLKKKQEKSDDEDDSEAGNIPARKNKKSNTVGMMRWTKNSARSESIGMLQAVTDQSILAATTNSHPQEWMLDTGTGVHVCTSDSAFAYLEEDEDMMFLDWKGGSASSDGVGLVRVWTVNSHEDNA
ncbi:hypothetical protein PF008_g4912 [Phytophthora fragariae]|uniref:CCHC-type domain-containing protein n=1 Tax=Phytophthora fragariae TaxID=53985 RepID=A0A6G0S9X4_9STRA|nr:hypothetical protein PF008_g4912 [Phytophthora fragariae]